MGMILHVQLVRSCFPCRSINHPSYNLQHWLVLISLENFPEQGRVNKVSCCYSVKLHRTSDIPVMEPCSDAYPASLEDKPIFLLSKVKKEQNEVANWLL